MQNIVMFQISFVFLTVAIFSADLYAWAYYQNPLSVSSDWITRTGSKYSNEYYKIKNMSF